MFSFTNMTNAKFANLAENDIWSYITTREPMDKTGSYGIQGVGGQFGESSVAVFIPVPIHYTRYLTAGQWIDLRGITSQ